MAVRSPAVGAFWVAPSPGQPPFVQVGQRVAQDEQLAIVEVMKLMNPVVATTAGEVVQICAANAEMVEYEQVLFWIRPTDGSPAAVAAGPSAPRPIRRVLVANRGEIAVRIVRACRRSGSSRWSSSPTADRDACAARLADRAVCIGPAAAAASYLAVRRSSAPRSAPAATPSTPATGSCPRTPSSRRACVAEGLVFVGPRAGRGRPGRRQGPGP